jgi:hypothetical protein
MKFLIASYPRSGNHLVRGLIEFGFRRPTLGARDFPRDLPIVDRPPNLERRMIAVEDRDPIGLKTHCLHRMLVHQQRFPDADTLLLITRRPCDAISSQLTRELRSTLWLTERRLRSAIGRGINDYLALMYAYRGWPPERRIHVEFERLVDQASSFDYVTAFLTRVGAPHLPTEAQWADLQQLTKDSQFSLGSRGNRRRLRLRAAVDAQLSHAYVREMLAS